MSGLLRYQNASLHSPFYTGWKKPYGKQVDRHVLHMVYVFEKIRRSN